MAAMGRGPPDTGNLDGPRPIGQLQDRLGGIDQPGAEIGVLRERPAGMRDRRRGIAVQRRAEGQFMESNYMTWDRDGNIYLGDTILPRVTELVAPNNAARPH